MASAKDLFTEAQRNTIVAAIQEAEKQTSGEIRVHIENTVKEDPLDRAVDLFYQLDMNQTALRNGVLIYLAVKDRQLAIIGDKGINEVVEEGFWDHIKDTMIAHFKEGQFTEGLSAGIAMAGEALRAYFPYQEDDKNELSDDISFNDA